MRGEINSNQYQISFRLKISLRCLASSLLLFTWIEVKWNSERYGFHISHFERNKTSNRHEIFMGTEFTRKEMNKRRLVLNLCLMRMCVWNSLRYGLQIGHFDRNEIWFRVIKYHVNNTRNELPTHVHQNVGSFWNAAEMKLHVNRTCFHAGLESQTRMSSFRLSCQGTLSEKPDICVVGF